MTEKRGLSFPLAAPLERMFPGTDPSRVRELMGMETFYLRTAVIKAGRNLREMRQAGLDTQNETIVFQKALKLIDKATKHLTSQGWKINEIGAADLAYFGDIILPERDK